MLDDLDVSEDPDLREDVEQVDVRRLALQRHGAKLAPQSQVRGKRIGAEIDEDALACRRFELADEGYDVGDRVQDVRADDDVGGLEVRLDPLRLDDVDVVEALPRDILPE